MQPVLVDEGLVPFDRDGPLATSGTPGVLPLGLYALLKEVEVCSRCEEGRLLDVVVQAATHVLLPGSASGATAPLHSQAGHSSPRVASIPTPLLSWIWRAARATP